MIPYRTRQKAMAHQRHPHRHPRHSTDPRLKDRDMAAGLEADLVSSQMGDLRLLSVIISRCGPFGSPSFCYLLGNVYRQTGLFRQSGNT